MSHILNGQIHLRVQVSIEQKQRLPNLSKHAETKNMYLGDISESQKHSLHEEICSQNAPYFSREESNAFHLTPIIPPSSKTWRWNKNRDPLLCSARGHHSLIHQRKSSFNTAMTAGVTKDCVAWNYSCCQKTILLMSKLKGFQTQTWRRWEFIFIVAISKFLIRQQSIYERHGCSLLQQCYS